MIRRAKEIDTLVLFSIATGGVVQRHWWRPRMPITALSSRIAVPTRTRKLHDALLDRLFPRRAEVISADDFV
jgi:hypothetical protein